MRPPGDDVDIIQGSQFHGLKTFGNLPYVNCFSDEQAVVKGNQYDIAIMGAPHDTVSVAQTAARLIALSSYPLVPLTPCCGTRALSDRRAARP